MFKFGIFLGLNVMQALAGGLPSGGNIILAETGDLLQAETSDFLITET